MYNFHYRLEAEKVMVKERERVMESVLVKERVQVDHRLHFVQP